MPKTTKISRWKPPLVVTPPSKRTRLQQAIYNEGYEIGKYDGMQETTREAQATLKKEREDLNRAKAQFKVVMHGSRSMVRALHDLLDAAGVE